jgi:hypothetical protein
MSRDNFTTPERGMTMYNGATIDTNDLQFLQYEGQTKIFEDINWGAAGVKTVRTGGREVVCRLVRNMSGATLYPKRLVQLDPTNPGRVTGYSRHSPRSRTRSTSSCPRPASRTATCSGSSSAGRRRS